VPLQIEPDTTGGACRDSSIANMDGSSQWKYNAPWGYRIVERKLLRRGLTLKRNRILVLVLTFLCYMSYHASRKPPSIVKSVLHGSMAGEQNAQDVEGLSLLDSAGRMLMESHRSHFRELSAEEVKKKKKPKPPGPNKNHTSAEGWAPFNDPDSGQSLLGDLDVSFLGAYALGMFVCGHLGDRLDLRKFLTWGMLGSGAFVVLFGMGYFWQIHSMPYFLMVQVLGGFFQATGWPSVVTVMANWFGHGKRGLVMGVWNAHTSVGNILGSLMAASMLQYGWGWSFVVPGALIMGMGILIYLFLVVEPQDIGFLPQSGSNVGSLAMSEASTPSRHSTDPFSSENRNLLERKLAIIAENHDGQVPDQITQSMQAHHHIRRPKHGMIAMGSTLVAINDDRESIDGESDNDSERDLLLGGGQQGRRSSGRASGVSFLSAWRLPGVAVYAFTLFFAKLVAYTFLYWLPYYISSTEVGGKRLSAAEAGKLSILFDVGGVMGGIVAGFLSDASSSPAIVSCSFVYLAIPVLYVYREYGSVSFQANILLMMVAGFFVNGPYALITTAVSADLGSSESVKGEKALATVTAIIDGMGSIGAAIGPMATGYISELPGGFDNVFTMLYGSALSAGLLLSSLVLRELGILLKKKNDEIDPHEGPRLRRGEVLNDSSFAFRDSGQIQVVIDNEDGIRR
jgi:OPA family glycerol-3-phosphate transporter-like MFS transporter 1/2